MQSTPANSQLIESALPAHVSLSVERLVTISLSQQQLSGLCEMLKCIAEEVRAYGCILWQVAPGSDFDMKQGHLFMMAQWFRDNQRSVFYWLPLQGSGAGQAVLDQEPVNLTSLSNDALLYRASSFLDQAEIKSICSVPISLQSGVKAALSVCRNTQEPFSEAEVKFIQRLARMVPSLYDTIRDRVSLDLIQRISRFVEETEPRALDTLLTRDRMNEVLRGICDLVAGTLNCVETSIILDDGLQSSSEVYRLAATTCPGWFITDTYGPASGITGWVLTKAAPIRIFDLANFERDKDTITRYYPGFNCSGATNVQHTISEVLNLPREENSPPLSFMAAPIVKGEKVYGVIRCSVVKEAPYYFADHDNELLLEIATQISNYWSNWLNRRELHEEVSSWRAFLKSLGKLNSFVRKELTRETPDENRIYAEALRVTSAVIEGAEIMDVRLLNEQSRELYFAETYGSAWNEGTEEEIRERKRRRFKTNEKFPTSGARGSFGRGNYM